MNEQRWYRKHNKLALTFIVITGSLLALSAFEFLLFLFLRFPSLNNYFPFLKSTVISIYYSNDRNILQFNPNHTQYDLELTYTMKPGDFDFCNREFCNHYSVNSLGVRDDEASLRQPEIIILGDSYALGWGVEQDETFAELLENQSGIKVLNAGVSSYGTVRELLLLRRIDTSRLKTVVLQYSNNDFAENSEYVKSGYQLNIRSREKYMAECERYMNRNRYRLLLYTSTFLRINILDRFFQRNPSDTILKSASASLPFSLIPMNIKTDQNQHEKINDNQYEAETFLDILSNEDFDGMEIVVLNLSHYTLDIHSFMKSLSELKVSDSYPAFIRNLKLIDTSEFLEKEDYYIIDDHLHKSGHQKVAKAIASAISVTSK